MSGGVVQLVATGPQDTWLTCKPEVSFFRTNYKRYTHYASSVERQVIQGNPIAGGISTIRFEKKGDLLSYVYLTATDANGSGVSSLDWTKVIDKIDLYVGGQIVDTHDIEYMTSVEPVTGAQSFSQRSLNQISSTFNNQLQSFLPIKFFFCKDWSVSLPLIGLQFHDVELRITWSANLTTSLPAGYGYTSPGSTGNYGSLQYQCWTNFIYLDQGERDYFAKTPQDLLITQVQRVVIGTNPVQELALAQPVKFLAFSGINYASTYMNGNPGTAGGGSAACTYLQLKTQVNGIDVGDSRPLIHWQDVPQYYNTPFAYATNTGANLTTNNVIIIPYCLDTSKLQPTGTLNFSRLDNYRLVVPASLSITSGGTTYKGISALQNNNAAGAAGGFNYTVHYIYAVSYNIFRIQNGLGSLLYAN